MADFRNQTDVQKALKHFTDEFDKRWEARRIDGQLHELQDLEADMERPDFWDDPEEARKLSVRKSALEKNLEPWKQLRQELTDFPSLVELTLEEAGGEKAGLEQVEQEFEALESKLEDLLLSEALMSEDDGRDALVTITSGAGGTESQDWADMLLRMYLRWMEKKEYKVETLDMQPGEEAGIKSVSILVKGESAFGYLKSENGVHRLVRISPFDSNKRRHTSFASVHVAPDIDDNIEIEVEEKDLRVDTYRASGAGGQHVNKTDSAIRITHIPTGIVVQCQNERSQHKNRATAMKMLKARLYEMEKEKQMEDMENRAGEKRDVAWGSQIRSYVFHPYKMVKDLRTQHETGNVDAVMDGDLDGFIEAYLKGLASGNDMRASTAEVAD
ncbi:MAG: peptide chain release factor 2 [Leptospiraceae bacterium]|nr:peptide chain release factor 2 [Leptospiraceae bacterium]